MDEASPQVPIDVSAVIDADWPEWQSALEDIRREYGDEGVRALLRRLQEYSIDQGVTLSDALLNTRISTRFLLTSSRHTPEISSSGNASKMLFGGTRPQ